MESPFLDVVKNLCDAERERMTAAEICIDELLTILDRRGLSRRDEIMLDLTSLSGLLHYVLSEVEGPELRVARLRRVRDVLTKALPLSDADLSVQ